MKLVVIILTKNESLHLNRCLTSAKLVSDHLLIVDSFSSDSTRDIARSFGATFIEHAFTNQARQFNYALTQVPEEAKWILRIDADEYLTPQLCISIKQVIDGDSIFAGYRLKRRISFAGRKIRYGGMFPVEITRLFRNGLGECEERWMDEHIKVNGPVGALEGELIDDNLNNLTWWIQKHNLYSNREAVEILKLRYSPAQVKVRLEGRARLKRLVKEHIYSKLPVVPKVFCYFLYRYIICFGFLDGNPGFTFHFLQGLWYRYLVEAKVHEVEMYINRQEVSLDEAVERVLEIKL